MIIFAQDRDVAVNDHYIRMLYVRPCEAENEETGEKDYEENQFKKVCYDNTIQLYQTHLEPLEERIKMLKEEKRGFF